MRETEREGGRKEEREKERERERERERESERERKNDIAISDLSFFTECAALLTAHHGSLGILGCRPLNRTGSKKLYYPWRKRVLLV